MARQADVSLVSSDLLETELRRMAVREGRDQVKVSAILDGVSLAALDRATYRSAGFLPMPYLRTLDALHLEAAMRLDVDAILTYDYRLAEAARAAALMSLLPGGSRLDEWSRVDFSRMIASDSSHEARAVIDDVLVGATRVVDSMREAVCRRGWMGRVAPTVADRVLGVCGCERDFTVRGCSTT
ncbi:PIN domain-containing protein [Paramicrobacterium humi]|uniref:PIN domain-containing protein n=1 Tax=Paramicrobacterium humi TaxID=640635 RepID=UPI001FE15CC9|nr:PIN domain-containing protein [Microbacterium humi]